MKLLTLDTIAQGKVIDISHHRATAVDRHVAEIIIENGMVIKDKRNGLRARRSATVQELAEARAPQRQMTEAGIVLRSKKCSDLLMIGPKRKKRVTPPSDDVWWAEWHAKQAECRHKALRQMTTQELEDELRRRNEHHGLHDLP